MRTPNPYNAEKSFNSWFDGKVQHPVITFESQAVGEEIETPSYAVKHNEISDMSLSSDDVIGSVVVGGETKKIKGRSVEGYARIVAYVGIVGDGYLRPQADYLLKMRNELFGLFRFRPTIPIRNYETNTNFADLEGNDKEVIVCSGIEEEPAISDVRDSYILLEQAFRVRYRYVHMVLSD